VTVATRLTATTPHAAGAPRASASAQGATAAARLSNSGGRTAATLGATPSAAAGPGVAPANGAGPGAAPAAAAAVGPAATAAGLPTPPPRTSCTAVVHIGDSTSEGLISADYLPNPADRITARYADVGVTSSIMKIVGATSIIESLPGTPNAYQMAAQVKQRGFHGCWVLALGTNDTADVYVGSNVGREQRIEKMMALIGDQPVMWVEVTSLLSSGPYAEQNMALWNQALAQALPRYPDMRVYDWPAVAQKSWFISDGIHYTTDGYQHRATAIADALAEDFPAS
jgi:lysophospholipase L1-like esterase